MNYLQLNRQLFISKMSCKIQKGGDELNIRLRIEELLKQRGWTMYRLAQEAEIPQSTLSNIFNRQQNEPTVSTLEIICKGFHITMSEFFAMEGEPISLNPEQREMLEQWNKLNEDQRVSLLAFLKTLAG